MSFAGHLKSKCLLSDTHTTAKISSPSRTIKAEKAALLEELKQKELELQRLRAVSSFAKPITISDTHVIHTRTIQPPQSALEPRVASTKLVDDRGNDPSSSLWVGNTPSNIRTADLRAAFSKYGPILSTKCLADCCFVNFAAVEHAIQAWKQCHEKEVFERGRQLYIRFTNSQTESRRAKDVQFERTSALHHPAHYSAEDDAPHLSIHQTPTSTVESSSCDSTNQWPNGSPPAGPKSHRRAISPPQLMRSSSWRTGAKFQHDIYRPVPNRRSTSLDDVTTAHREHHPDQIVSKRKDNYASVDSHDHPDNETQAFKEPSSQTPAISQPPTSQMISNQQTSSVKANEQDHSALLAEAKLKLLRKASSSAVLQQSLVSSTNIVSAECPEGAKRVTDSRSDTYPDQILGDDRKVNSPSFALNLDHNDPEDTEAEMRKAVPTRAAQDWPGPYGDPALVCFSPLLHYAYKFPSILPANKRLRLESDEIASMSSGKSSLSNSSGRDRRCRGCKKLGNEKGLHMLFKCVSCTRRYHAYCGHPRPDQSADPSKFVCEKCIRTRNKEQCQVNSCKLLTADKIFQLASPPLSHDNHDSESGAAYRKQDLASNFDPATVSADFNVDAPPTPDALSTDEHVNEVNSRRSDDFLTTPECRGPVATYPSYHDGATDVMLTAFQQMPQEKRYSGVTCPWWKKGNRCRLREDDCLYSHSDTGILSPDGFKMNRKWTCFFWLHGIDCPATDTSCKYSHHDTGLHTWKDGRASLKHVTCFWWATRGVCKHDDRDCRYAHIDTGLYSPDPSDKQAGMATSTVRPQSTLFLPSSPHLPRSTESSLEENRNLDSADPTTVVQAPNKARYVEPTTDLFALIGQSVEDSTGDPVHGTTSGNGRSQSWMNNLEHGWVIQSKRKLGAPHGVKRKLDDIDDSATCDAASEQPATHNQEPDASTKPDLNTTAGAWHQIPSLPDVQVLQQVDSFRARPVDEELAQSSMKHMGNQRDEPTKDPRKALYLLQTRNSSQNAHDQQRHVDLAVTIDLATDLNSSLKAGLSTVSEPTSSTNTHLGANQSYKKCENCAKTVFGSSKKHCRDCSRSQESLQLTTIELTHPKVSATRASSISTSPGIARINTVSIGQESVETKTEHVPRLDQKPLPKLPAKRSAGCDDMFITSKRPRIRRGSSSANKPRLSAAPNIGWPKRHEPQSISERIEELRLEKRKNSLQAPPASTQTKERAKEANAGQSDKENETPVTEHDPSSPSVTFTGKSSVESMRINVTATSFEKPVHYSDIASVKELEKNSEASTSDQSDQDDGSMILSDTVQDELASDSDEFYDVSEQLNDNLSPKATPVRQYRCAECKRKHKSCLHNAAKRFDGTSHAMLSGPELGPSNHSTVPLIAPQNEPRLIEKLTSTACERCKHQRKRCLHGTDRSSLDQIKCQRYLRENRQQKDNPPSYTTWDEIKTAAQLGDEILYEGVARDIHVNKDKDLEVIPLCFSSTHDVSISNNGDKEPSTNAEEVLIDSIYSGTSNSSEVTCVPTDSIAILVNSDINTAVNRLSFLANLDYDHEHVAKLKSEGIEFESDEEDDDYLSDDLAIVDIKPVSDPLLVAPKSSRNLFDICPEMHPGRTGLFRLVSQRLTFPKQSRKEEWKQLRNRRLRFDERRQLYGNPHWEVCRRLPEPKVSTLVERILPGRDEELPRVERKEWPITFQEFLGAPKQPEACLAGDGALAFKDGARDLDQTSFARSARGLGRRPLDEDKFPVYER